MKKLLILGLLLFNIAWADNTGFIPGSIWYSEEPLKAGQSVEIYTLVWNSNDVDLITDVEFYDKNVVLGSRNVIVPANSFKDVSIPWQVTAGDHIISAKILSDEVPIERRQTPEDKKFVAQNKDVVKNQIDEISTKVEKAIPPVVAEKLNIVEEFRKEKSKLIEEEKIKTKERISELDSFTGETDGIEGTEKPIATVKLFLLKILGYIFSNKFIFWGVGILIAFIIIRFIFRKIRRR
ncbi:MAG: hypothetical protein U9R00_03095 [Patescibacteria group bacterium]|nr:hypothetical protein [Patescibacteria group bacterium]